MTETEERPVDILPPLPAEGVDLDELRRLMLAIDMRAHRAGWEKDPSQAYVLFDNRVHSTAKWWRMTLGEHERYGPAIRVGWMSAQAFVTFDKQTMLGPHGRGVGGRQPYQLLGNIAANLAFANPDEQVTERARIGDGVSIYRQPGTFGFAFKTYAWMQAGLDREQMMVVTADPPPDFSQLPGSQDTRVTSAIDLTGAVHDVYRHRGKGPTVRMNRGGGGDITTSLRMFASVTTGTAPTTQEEFDERFPRLRVAVGLEEGP